MPMQYEQNTLCNADHSIGWHS